MAEPVLISICIPAYKNPEFLKRLLDSIAIQSFKNFEVIITDDSPDDGLINLVESYKTQFSLAYFRNFPAEGTPENWNQSIRMAAGQWIKLMHDDDWFSNKDALSSFAGFINQHPKIEFIFSAYENIFLKDGRKERIFPGNFRMKMLKKNPATLFSRNIVGPPSVTIHRANADITYDKQLKWLVDIDFYMRWLQKTEAAFIPNNLICVGISDQQVTMDCFRRRPVEIPENFYVLNRTGRKNLKNIMVYDAWWRLMRNLEIKKTEDIRGAGYQGEIGEAIISMINWQCRVPSWFLKQGLFSKCIMFTHYILNYGKIQH
jgi:glycosyltransferase involved in cell wall biosynthesis